MNFNFNSATGKIIQSGSFDNPATGLDLGINYGAGETGIDFYTSNGATEFGQPAQVGTLVLENVLAPQGCDTFPSATCERLSTGGTLTATAVPEPAPIVGLLALAVIGAGSTFKKKFGSVQAAQSRSFLG